MCRFPTTIHVHGLRFNKNDEGSGYADDTSGASKTDDGLPTGRGLGSTCCICGDSDSTLHLGMLA